MTSICRSRKCKQQGFPNPRLTITHPRYPREHRPPPLGFDNNKYISDKKLVSALNSAQCKNKCDVADDHGISKQVNAQLSD